MSHIKMHDLAKLATYIDGEKVDIRFKGLTIPVIEFNEALPVIRKMLLDSFRHGKNFGQHLTGEDYLRSILDEYEK